MPLYATIAAAVANVGALIVLITSRVDRGRAARLALVSRSCLMLVLGTAVLWFALGFVELSAELPADEIPSKAAYLGRGISGIMNSGTFVAVFGALPWFAKRAADRRVAAGDRGRAGSDG